MTRLRLALEWFLNPDHVPFLIGLERGWFREAGLELELIEPRAHVDAADALARGDIEVAITEPIHLVQDLAAGREVVGFARFLHTNGGVMYLRGRGIERPRDMAKARVQYPGAPGPGGPAIVATMVQADGGAYAPEALTPVNHGFFHTNALAEGRADVATLAFWNFELVEAAHRGLDAGFFALKDWGVPDFCQLILMTRPQLLERERAAFSALVQVLRRGIDLLKTNPTEAQALYARHTKAPADDALGPKLFAATLPCFTYDLTMASEAYGLLADWLLKTKQVAAPVNVSRAWTNQLALR
ncbi:MAG: ABC transporter substrate-binding protein [Myxococcaceae bacterium]|jgi:putative hydroxymethylpyrimidine transport system substrate-binding protein|nr:ABC transporter substrate-binding protein [Myxococcaceae bacterium]